MELTCRLSRCSGLGLRPGTQTGRSISKVFVFFDRGGGRHGVYLKEELRYKIVARHTLTSVLDYILYLFAPSVLTIE
jgi:hypothetical protein